MANLASVKMVVLKSSNWAWSLTSKATCNEIIEISRKIGGVLNH
jgi:hypothetical protein